MGNGKWEMGNGKWGMAEKRVKEAAIQLTPCG